MKTERFARLKQLVLDVVDLPTGDRSAYLEEIERTDPALCRDIESMLDCDLMSCPAVLQVDDVTPFLTLIRGLAEADEALEGDIGTDESGSDPALIEHEAPPEELGCYRIEGEIGRGGMGVIYHGFDRQRNRSVAIKLLPARLAGTREIMRRFRREATLLAALEHPNIAAFYSLESEGGHHFITLEYVDGETLATRLSAGPISIAETCRVCGQVAEALEVAHDRGIVHCDLKPANIKLTADGLVKVLDFGIARAMHRDLLTTSLISTQSGTHFGTPAYMSPEQIRSQEIDHRTDVWALGCVLYECLVGRRVFEGKSLFRTMTAVLDREPDWEVLPAETPDWLCELLRGCLEKSSETRVESARRVKEVLRR